LHAGTALEGGRLVTSGGRVLSVVGSGDNLAQAAARAYAAAELIDFPGKQLRHDIAKCARHIPPLLGAPSLGRLAVSLA
jgi:phosphoribosylamine--glycine ligase